MHQGMLDVEILGVVKYSNVLAIDSGFGNCVLVC